MDFEEEPQSKIDHERISISVVPNHGRFRRAIPCMSMPLAAFCCFCNFIPGLGTFLAALSVLCCTDPRTDSRFGCFATNCLAAFLQLILSPLVIGFIWSVIWGVLFIQISHDRDRDMRIAEREAKALARQCAMKTGAFLES